MKLAAAVLLSCASGAFACTSAGDLCLNEVQTYGTGSPSARRATQYLELRGPAGASIAITLYLVGVALATLPPEAAEAVKRATDVNGKVGASVVMEGKK